MMGTIGRVTVTDNQCPGNVSGLVRAACGVLNHPFLSDEFRVNMLGGLRP